MITNLTAIFEGYGRVSSFNYLNYERDPTPEVLILGSYVNHKGTKLICGINIRNMPEGELTKLRLALPRILSWPKEAGKTRAKSRRLNGKDGRYWTGRALLPNIFKTRYRSYDASQIENQTDSTISLEKFNDEDEQRAIKLANDDGYPIDSLDDFGTSDENLKIEYLGKAVIDRALAAKEPEPKAKPMPPSYPPTPPAPPAPTPIPPAPPAGPGGMAPITPEQAVPGAQPAPPPVPPTPPTPAPPPMPMPKPTSPGRRGTKHLPGRQAPQKPPEASSGGGDRPTLPLPPTSRQRREKGASRAIDNLEQRKFNIGKEKEQEGEELHGPPEA